MNYILKFHCVDTMFRSEMNYFGVSQPFVPRIGESLYGGIVTDGRTRLVKNVTYEFHNHEIRVNIDLGLS